MTGRAQPWPSSEAAPAGSQARGGVGGAQECGGSGPGTAHSRDTCAAEATGLAVPAGQGVPAPSPRPAGWRAGGWGHAVPRDTGAPLGAWVRWDPGPVCILLSCGSAQVPASVSGAVKWVSNLVSWDGRGRVTRPTCLQSGSQVDPARPCPVPTGGGSADAGLGARADQSGLSLLPSPSRGCQRSGLQVAALGRPGGRVSEPPGPAWTPAGLAQWRVGT